MKKSETSALQADQISSVKPSINLGAKYRKVGILGIPVSDTSPLGEAEGDSGSFNLIHVDMFSLSLQTSFVDVNIPCEGGELGVQFSRSFSTTKISIDEENQVGVLGIGWNTNINSQITTTEENGSTMASIIDEDGTSFTFFERAKGIGFQPLFTNPTSNASRKIKFKKLTDRTILITKWQRTQLRFERFESKQKEGKRTTRYRLKEVSDRNKNTLIYKYDSSNKFLVKSIHEKAHPLRIIKFSYKSIGSSPIVFDCGFRLTKITDPLGRVTSFAYSSKISTPDPVISSLATVKSPKVKVKGVLTTPSFQFTYKAEKIINPATQKEEIATALRKVIMPNQYEFKFDHVIKNAPQLVNGGKIIRIPRYELRKVNTVDGSCSFKSQIVELLRVKTFAVNSDNVENSYFFNSKQIKIPNQAIPGIFIHKLTRETKGLGSVIYNFSSDPNQNLEKVVDCSGNTILYEYSSNDAEDPYNKAINPSIPINPITNPNSYQAFNQPALEIHDPNGLNIRRSYRYSKRFNKLARFTNEIGSTIKHVFDTRGNRIKIVEPLNTISQFKYTDDGFVKEQTDPDGRVKSFERKFNVSTPESYKEVIGTIEGFENEKFRTPNQIRNCFDLIGNEVSVTDPKGNTIERIYNSQDQLIEVILPPVANPLTRRKKRSSQKFEYDVMGNQIKSISHTNNIELTTYDGLNRVVENRILMGSPDERSDQDLVSKFQYNFAGWLLQETNPNGNTFNFEYDNFGRVTQKTSPEVNVLRTSKRNVVRLIYGENSGSGAFSYSGGWQATKQINPRGFETHFQLDNLYRLTREVSRKDKNTTLKPSDPPASGEPWTSFDYDQRGLVIKEVVAHQQKDDNTTVLSNISLYDALGRKTVNIERNSEQEISISVGCSISQQLKNTVAENDIVTRNWYDKSGNMIKHQDAEGAITLNFFDGAERKIRTILPKRKIKDTSDYNPNGLHNPEINYVYDANGNQAEVIDENHIRSISEYDARNRIVRSKIKSANRREDQSTTTTYDFQGRILTVTDGRGGKMQYEYDKAGREIRSFAPPGQNQKQQSKRETQTKYDKNGNIIKIEYEGGQEVLSEYDTLNRLTTINVSPQRGGQTGCRSIYDENGNVVEILYTQNNIEVSIKRTYDAFDRLISEEMPNIGDNKKRISFFEYCLNDKLFRSKNPNGDIQEMFYDGFGRTEKILYSDAKQNKTFERKFTYNKRDELLSIHDDMGADITLIRNNVGQVIKTFFKDEGHDSYSLESSYDARGNRTELHYPNKTRSLFFSYDIKNRLTQISDGNKNTSYQYDSNNNLVVIKKPDGVVEQRVYDLFNRLTLLHVISNKVSLYRSTYDYNKGGSCIGTTQNWHEGPQLTTEYAYDSKNRLIREFWGEAGFEYTYDDMGNRLSEKGLGSEANVQNQYTYNLLNQLTSLRTKEEIIDFEYDLNGNIILENIDGNVKKEYVWDCLDRLTYCSLENGNSFNAKYDYQDHKYWTKDGDQVKIDRWDNSVSIQEIIDASITDYIYGVGMGGGIGGLLYTEESGTDYIGYHSNMHGHNVATTNFEGIKVGIIGYSAFGKTIHETEATHIKRRAFTKERIASLDLDYHGKRYYDPRSGRYISRDPLSFNDSVNNYLFVNNNPINMIDHEGEWWDFVQGALDIASAIPVIGTAASLVNAGISVCKGDLEGVVSNLVGAVPGLGAAKLIAKAAKHAKKAIDLAKKVKKGIDKAYEIKDKVNDAIDTVEAIATGDPSVVMAMAAGPGKGKKQNKKQGGNGNVKSRREKVLERRAEEQKKNSQSPEDTTFIGSDAQDGGYQVVSTDIKKVNESLDIAVKDSNGRIKKGKSTPTNRNKIFEETHDLRTKNGKKVVTEIRVQKGKASSDINQTQDRIVRTLKGNKGDYRNPNGKVIEGSSKKKRDRGHTLLRKRGKYKGK